MASIIWAVWIPWYRVIWGVCTPVTKIRKILDDDCPQCEPVDCYSDDGTAIAPAVWYEWKCNPPKYDFEPVLITNDWGITVVPWVSRWEIIDWTPIQKLYDKDGNDVTATHELAKDTSWEKFDISDKLWFCSWGTTTISRTDIIDVSWVTPLIVWSIRQDIDWVMIAAPASWTVTPIQCSWSEQYDIRSAWFYCINWTTTLERFDIIDLWTQTIASSIWQDLTWTVVSTPVWVITAWACSVSPSIYDNQEQFRVTWATPPAPYDTDSTDWASITLAANTYKSISIAILVWYASIVQNGKTHTFWEWYVRNYSVTDLADNAITITQASSDCVATITTVTI